MERARALMGNFQHGDDRFNSLRWIKLQAKPTGTSLGRLRYTSCTRLLKALPPEFVRRQYRGRCSMRNALTLAFAPVLYLTACGSGGEIVAPPPTGTLQITTTTTGAETDPDGYTFQIDGGPNTPIGTSASASTELAAGTHSIRLDGVAPNCS